MHNYQFLVEVDETSSGLFTLTHRFCGNPQFTNSEEEWLPYLIDPGLSETSLFSGGKTTGRSSGSNGEIVLSNFKSFTSSDGPLDYMTDFPVYGKNVRMYYGPPNAEFPSGFTLGYTAMCGVPTVTWDEIRIPLLSLQDSLDIPFDTGTFLGTNIAPNGLEGDADIKDKEKPMVIGRPFNITPVLCNKSKLIYAVSPLTGISVNEYNSNIQVFDEGVQLYFAGKVADIQTSAPPAGQFYASEAGYIRLGSNPSGAVTCNCVTKGLALTSKPAELIRLLLTLSDKAAMIDESSFASYTTFDNYERGVFITGKTNISELIDMIVAPLGYWYINESGKVVLGYLQDPENIASLYALNSSVNLEEDFTKYKSSDTKGGAIASKVIMKYKRNYTIQQKTAGAVTADYKQKLATEWNNSVHINPMLHEASGPVEFETCLTSGNATFLNNLSELYETERWLVEVKVMPDEFLSAKQIPPGGCVTLSLTNGRFNYSNKKMIVVKKLENYVEESLNLTLWG